MFRLDQHIELLLLKQDCVIVPEFGGFVVHHIAAHIDKADGMMLPPKHVVGFNQQLNINDSILVQSYIDSYDLSYPEALSHIEAEVNELKCMIADYGHYDFRSIGRISLNGNGMYEFEPTEGGITVPMLYGLSGVDTTNATSFLSKEEKRMQPDLYVNDEEDENSFIKIPTSTLRNVAVACAVIALMVFLPMLNKNNKAQELFSAIDTSFFSNISLNNVHEEIRPMEHKTHHVYVTKKVVVAPKTENAEKEVTQETEEKTVETADNAFTVVLAARISQANAESYVADLEKRGFKDVKVIGEGKGRKVVCGAFATEEEAQQKRRELCEDAEFESAWITQIK